MKVNKRNEKRKKEENWKILKSQNQGKNEQMSKTTRKKEKFWKNALTRTYVCMSVCMYTSNTSATGRMWP